VCHDIFMDLKSPRDEGQGEGRHGGTGVYGQDGRSSYEITTYIIL
jgi:hypothetical protein